MNEIEYRAERAQHYQQFIDYPGNNHWEWCVYIGLWETCGWLSKTSGYDIISWLEAVQRDE